MRPNDIGQTIPIVYPVGAYGSYLEWVLTTITSDIDVVPPFEKDGSSHRFTGNHLDNITGWAEYVKKNLPKSFVRFHPKASKEESIVDNIATILTVVDKIIYVYPPQDTQLLIDNNFWTKGGENYYQTVVNINDIYSNWPVTKNMPPAVIPNWIKREYLSFYLIPSWNERIGDPIESNASILSVTVTDLLLNFEATIETIKTFCNLSAKKPTSDMVPYHNQMLNLQPYLNCDALCNQIVDATLSGAVFDWQHESLTIISESWIQWKLRTQGFEIKCHGLDIFPTNSVNLQKLIYKI